MSVQNPEKMRKIHRLKASTLLVFVENRAKSDDKPEVLGTPKGSTKYFTRSKFQSPVRGTPGPQSARGCCEPIEHLLRFPPARTNILRMRLGVRFGMSLGASCSLPVAPTALRLKLGNCITHT
jgi:hypothetical protein